MKIQRINLLLGQIYQRISQRWVRWKQTRSVVESADYLRWRHEFLYKRLGFGLWLGFICFFISASGGLYLYIFQIEQVRADLDRFYGTPSIAEDLRDITLIGFFIIPGLILACLAIRRMAWGKRHPEIVFLIFAGAVNGFT
ncbi:MAG: hypothetical protein AAF716_02195 [Cyanobacteria bacterium P01_D01_bin.1]